MRKTTEATIESVMKTGADYDRGRKALWRHRELLAPILKYTVDEYKDLTVQEIVSLIDADMLGENLPVSDLPSEIIDRGTEQTSVTEKTIHYDVLCRAKNPALSDENILVMLYIDVEDQMKYRPTNPSYPITKRAMYYLARELSRQLGTLTETTNYANLEKVYSIWICNRDVPKSLQNTVTKFSMRKENVIGEDTEPDHFFDLMTAVIIRRGDDKEASEDIFRYISSLRSGDIETVEHYVGRMDDAIRKEISMVSGMGMTLYQEGIANGMSEGKIIGMSEGGTLMGRLASILVKEGRADEIERVTEDEKARKEYYKKYGLID